MIHGQNNTYPLKNNEQLTAGNLKAYLTEKVAFEIWKIAKFAVVGATTFLFQLVLYLIFTRYLMPELTRFLTYTLAMGYAMAENYTAHRLWTFKDHNIPDRSAFRYALVVFAAGLVNIAIFYLGHHVFLIYDLLVVIFAGLIVPLITYAGHRWYTFKSLSHFGRLPRPMRDKSSP